MLLSIIMAAPICIPTNSARGFPFLYTVAGVCYLWMKPGFELVLYLHPRSRLFFLLLLLISTSKNIHVTFLSVIIFYPDILKMPVEVSPE